MSFFYSFLQIFFFASFLLSSVSFYFFELSLLVNFNLPVAVGHFSLQIRSFFCISSFFLPVNPVSTNSFVLKHQRNLWYMNTYPILPLQHSGFTFRNFVKKPQPINPHIPENFLGIQTITRNFLDHLSLLFP